MFTETKKYKNNGHFTFNKGDALSVVSKGVPKLPGVYYIAYPTNGSDKLLYIGKSGTRKQDGTWSKQLLRGRINNKQAKIKRQEYFEQKMEAEQINALDIYWFVTYDEKHKDLPGYVEGLLLQRYFEMHGTLPPWNKEF